MSYSYWIGLFGFFSFDSIMPWVFIIVITSAIYAAISTFFVLNKGEYLFKDSENIKKIFILTSLFIIILLLNGLVGFLIFSMIYLGIYLTLTNN